MDPPSPQFRFLVLYAFSGSEVFDWHQILSVGIFWLKYRSCHVFYDPICFHDWDKTPQNQSETLNARNFHANLTTGGHIVIHDWKIRTLFESHENIFPCSCDFDQFWSESTDSAACGSFRRTIVSPGMRAGFYRRITSTDGTCRTL